MVVLKLGLGEKFGPEIWPSHVFYQDMTVYQINKHISFCLLLILKLQPDVTVRGVTSCF